MPAFSPLVLLSLIWVHQLQSPSCCSWTLSVTFNMFLIYLDLYCIYRETLSFAPPPFNLCSSIVQRDSNICHESTYYSLSQEPCFSVFFLPLTLWRNVTPSPAFCVNFGTGWVCEVGAGSKIWPFALPPPLSLL